MNKHPRSLVSHLVLIILLTIPLVVSCGVVPSLYSNTPEGVTKKLFDSIQENDVNKYLDSITPEDRQQPGYFFYRQLVEGVFGAMGLGQVEASKTKVNFSNLTISEASNDGTIAQVQVAGHIRDESLGIEQDFSTTVSVIKLNGTWLVSVSGDAAAQATAQAFSTQFKVYLQHVLVGDSANQAMSQSAGPPADGWQYVVFDLIIEDVGQQPMWSPQTLNGNLIDSGGYQRAFSVTLYATRTYLMLPGIRYRITANVLMPLNQSAVSVQVGFNGGAPVFNLDAKNPDDSLAVPFNNMPSGIPVAQNNTMQYTQTGAYRLTYSNFAFYQNEFSPDKAVLDVDVQAENMGGNDINPNFPPAGPFFVGVDSRGNYVEAYELRPIFPYFTVPPGMTKQTTAAEIAVLGPYAAYNWIWLVLLDPNLQPIAQIQVQRNNVGPAPTQPSQ